MKNIKKIMKLLIIIIISNILMSCNNTSNNNLNKCQHIYDYQCSTNCSICGEMRDNAISHNWTTINKLNSTLFSEGSETIQCSICNTEYSQTFNIIDPTTLNMPIVYIDDLQESKVSLLELDKSDGEINVKYRYVSNNSAIANFQAFTKIKVQGSSSAVFPKKNFTVKHYKDSDYTQKLKVDLGWGKENKYCMKANYIDFSQARNIVSAKLYAEVVSSRANINTGLINAPNYGVIDGYPVLVYINGIFHGIYTMNIPKDEWLFNMNGDENSQEALLMADSWKTQSIKLIQEIGENPEDYGWEIEYCSTDDQTWVIESFNKFIRLINNTNTEKIKQELAYHLDIEAAIDNMIFTYFIDAVDNTAKNILWATYDGKVWIPSMYDMDGTFGIYYDGSPSQNHVYPSFNDDGSYNIPGNKMYEILISLYPDEVEKRYKQLRQKILTSENTKKLFSEFFSDINEIAYISDGERWPSIPYISINRTNMYEANIKQIELLDQFFYNFNKK